MAARESASGSGALRDGRPRRRAEPLEHPSGAPRAALGECVVTLTPREGFSDDGVDSLDEIGQLKQAIDTNDLARVKNLITRNPELHRAPLGYAKNGPLTWVAECRV